MKILVTGANGFIGSHLCAQLVKQGHSVVATRRSSSQIDQFHAVFKSHNLSPEKIEWRITSLTTPWEVEDAFKSASAVYHTAGKVSFEKKDVYALIYANVDLTSRIVNACLNLGIPLCHFSSTSVFPVRNSIHTDWPLSNPEGKRSAYGESKYLAELEVWRGREEGLEAVIVNPGIVLGYGDWNSGSTALFKKAFNSFPFYTNGVTGFVGVEDVCKASIQLMKSGYFKERFLLVENNYPFKEVQDAMSEGFGSNQPKIKVGPPVSKLIAALSAPMSWLGVKPLITKETAQSAHRVSRFDGSRITRALAEFAYTPLKGVIHQACEEYQKV